MGLFLFVDEYNTPDGTWWRFSEAVSEFFGGKFRRAKRLLVGVGFRRVLLRNECFRRVIDIFVITIRIKGKKRNIKEKKKF